MTIHLENEFKVPLSVERTWAALTNIPLVAECVPGASLARHDGNGGYQGKVGLSMGPIAVEYNGDIQVVSQDDAAHILTLQAKGKDMRGQGTASARFVVQVTGGPDETKAMLVTDVEVTGRVAQFGRGIMQQVASKIVQQFSANLRRELMRDPASPTAEGARFGTAALAAIGAAAVALIGVLVVRRRRR